MSASVLQTVPFLARRSLRQHALSSGITAASIALASGLVMAVFSINAQTYDAFTAGATAFDAVLGARGSQLQLVLNTVFHLETSPGNLPWAAYEAIRKDNRVDAAFPYALGDNYRGFRIVGTTEEFYSYMAGQPTHAFAIKQPGRWFNPARREAVVGSVAAARAGLRPGVLFNPYHGLSTAESSKHAEEYVVVGVLNSTNTPADRVIWIPLEGIYRMSGHVLRGAGQDYVAEAGKPIPPEAKEVSAVMLKLKHPQAGFSLEQLINRQGTAATLAWPISRVMAELFDKLGWMHGVLTAVAYLVALVAAASISASMVNAISERQRDFAILRALGAQRRIVFASVVAESGAIAAAGSLLGFGVYLAILAAAYSVIRAQTGVVLDLFWFHPIFIWAPVGMTILGVLAGILPAALAYGTDVASNLVPRS